MQKKKKTNGLKEWWMDEVVWRKAQSLWYVTILFSMCCFRKCWFSDKFTPWFSTQTPLNFFISVQMTAPSQWPLWKIRKWRLCQLLLSFLPFQEWADSSCQLGAARVHAHRTIPEGHLFRYPQSEAGIMSARCETTFSRDGHYSHLLFSGYLWLSPF